MGRSEAAQQAVCHPVLQPPPEEGDAALPPAAGCPLPPFLPQAAARLGPQDSSAVDTAPPLPLQITFEISKQEDSQIPIWIIVGSTLGGLLLLALLVLALWKVRAPRWGAQHPGCPGLGPQPLSCVAGAHVLLLVGAGPAQPPPQNAPAPHHSRQMGHQRALNLWLQPFCGSPSGSLMKASLPLIRKKSKHTQPQNFSNLMSGCEEIP